MQRILLIDNYDSFTYNLVESFRRLDGCNLEVELLEGRAIRPGDDAAAPQVTLINRAAAERYFPDGAIGQEIVFWGIPRRIVGVIGDERFQGVDAPAEPAAYAPLAQNPQQVATVLVRADDGIVLASADLTWRTGGRR